MIEITWTKGKPMPPWWDDFVLYGLIFVVVFCATYMIQEMIRIAGEERARYKNAWNDDGSPNRPGAWGIQ